MTMTEVAVNEVPIPRPAHPTSGSSGQSAWRRRYQTAMSEYQRTLTDPQILATQRSALARCAPSTCAYQAGVEAWECGDLRLAALQFRIAAGYHIGDAALRLAEILLYLGDYEGALAWCSVVAADGEFPDEVTELIVRCQRSARTGLPE